MTRGETKEKIMKSWTYYQVETKSDQYGSRVRRIYRTTKTKALENSTGCSDCGGVRVSAYRARSKDIAAVKNGIENDGGIPVECLS